MSKVIKMRSRNVTPGGHACPAGVTGCEDGDVIALVNLRTGEQLGYYTHNDKASPEEPEWVRLYQRYARHLADTGVLSSILEYRILMFMIGSVGYGNSAVINQSDLARQWGMKSRGRINSALRSLEQKRLVVMMQRTNVGCSYRLDPNFGWKGKNEIRRTMLEKDMRERLESIEPQEPAASGLFHARAIGDE